MVFFTCNGCNEALKKNQVEKHKYRCRNCQSLSCVDCGKDFWGSEFQTHTKCMTENEKYCGKGYVAKVNKGEVKQEQWIEKVQVAIEKASSNVKLRGLLQQLQDYPNIPRKKAKFENFLKNSVRVLSPVLISQVWDLLMESTKDTAEKKENGSINSVQPKNDNTNTISEISNGISTNGTGPSDDNESDKKMCKREKKEERQNKNKKEKKDKLISESTDGDENVKKKKKKRKHQDESEEESNTSEEPVKGKKRKLEEEPVGEQDSKKKKSKKDKGLQEQLTNGELEQIENVLPEPDCDSQEKKQKFIWDQAITDILTKKGEISLKKLRRKVLQAFLADDPTSHDQETAGIKFNKKLRKMSQVIVEKERVRLK